MIAVVLIIAVIVSAVVIAMTKGKNAKKSSGLPFLLALLPFTDANSHHLIS